MLHRINDFNQKYKNRMKKTPIFIGGVLFKTRYRIFEPISLDNYIKTALLRDKSVIHSINVCVFFYFYSV